MTKRPDPNSHVAEGTSPKRPPSSQTSPWGSSSVASTSTPARAHDPSRKQRTNGNRASTTTGEQAPCRFFLQTHDNKGDPPQWIYEYKRVRIQFLITIANLQADGKDSKKT
ncbi:hypothetical protein AX14_011149 [Amanita brunnescens Koide BX004]|nr:hypothetical protein AX14_011149 [Amanita brunnescens Koide BX004]